MEARFRHRIVRVVHRREGPDDLLGVVFERGDRSPRGRGCAVTALAAWRAKRSRSGLQVPLLVFFAAMLSLAVVGRLYADPGDPSRPQPWEGREDEIVRCLETGTLVHREPIGRGINNPERVTLACRDGATMRGVWKVLGVTAQRTDWRESNVSEVVAYRLDRVIDLGLVPPTVQRRINGMKGSLQFWVDDHTALIDASEELRGRVTPEQWARIQLFDHLINNPDRNQGNVLLADSGQIVLIDHSRADLTRSRFIGSAEWLPRYFDRRLVAEMKAMTEDELQSAMGDLLKPGKLRVLLVRRDQVLERVEREAGKRDGKVFF